MTTIQTVVVLLVGAGALLWGAFGLADYNLIAEIAANYPTLQTVLYGTVGAAGAIFLIEIFTETEILEILD